MKRLIKISGWMVLIMLGLLTDASAQSSKSFNLTARTFGFHPLWDGDSVKIYGFNISWAAPPILPGPTIEVNEGDTVTVNMMNFSQGAPHTIHWHGLDVDQYNDGVPMLSWDIHHMADSDYVWVAPHPGTYLYHCHVASIVHVQMGMYGSVIVRPQGDPKRAWSGGPAFDYEYSWLMSEIDKEWHDNIPVHSTGDSVHAVFTVPDYIPDYFLVSGKSKQLLLDADSHVKADPGDTVLLRLSNVGYLLNRVVFPANLNATVIMSDGRPLPAQSRQDTLYLAPGERYGVLLHAAAETDTTVEVAYLDMNNMSLLATESPHVTFRMGVGIPEAASEPEISVYPNPASGSFTVSYAGAAAAPYEFGLYSLNGQQVLQSEGAVSNPVLEYSTAGIPAGMYVAVIKTAEQVITKKIVISE